VVQHRSYRWLIMDGGGSSSSPPAQHDGPTPGGQLDDMKYF
jgi:hypothetical protein